MSKDGSLNRIASYKEALISKTDPISKARLKRKIADEEAFFEKTYGKQEAKPKASPKKSDK